MLPFVRLIPSAPRDEEAMVVEQAVYAEGLQEREVSLFTCGLAGARIPCFR